MSVADRIAAVTGRDVPRETFLRLEKFVALLLAENARQNLISAKSAGDIWERHIADGAQLLRFQPDPRASWLDIGSGAGLPGLVVAILTAGPVTLVEPRRLRAEFLAATADALGLGDRVTVICAKIDKIAGEFDTITARAVAPVDRLLAMSVSLAHESTIWVLPKGRGGEKELEDARRSWQGAFRTEASMTDAEAVIVVASRVRAIMGAKGRR